MLVVVARLGKGDGGKKIGDGRTVVVVIEDAGRGSKVGYRRWGEEDRRCQNDGGGNKGEDVGLVPVNPDVKPSKWRRVIRDRMSNGSVVQ